MNKLKEYFIPIKKTLSFRTSNLKKLSGNMMIKKRFILVIMIILTFSISLVSANEDLNNVGYSDDLQVNSTYSGSVLTAPGNAGTFSDLNSNIQANSNIILDKRL